MRSLLPILVFPLVLVSCAQRKDDAKPSSASAPLPLVGVLTPMSHPSLEATIDGFRKGLAEAGFNPANVNIEVSNANADGDKVASLLRQLIGRRPALVFCLTTGAATTAAKLCAEQKVPLVYAAVTDPVGAGIVTSMTGSETAATGVSDRYPVSEQVRCWRSIHPPIRSAAVLYNPAEQNSQILSASTQEEFNKAGVKCERIAVNSIEEIRPKTLSALRSFDAVVVNGDNLITENLEVVIRASVEAKKPLFVGDPDSVRRGAVATVGPSYVDMGQLAGQKASRILKGEDPRTIPSSYPDRFDYIVNVQAASLMGVSIPTDFWKLREVWESPARLSTAK